MKFVPGVCRRCGLKRPAGGAITPARCKALVDGVRREYDRHAWVPL